MIARFRTVIALALCSTQWVALSGAVGSTTRTSRN